MSLSGSNGAAIIEEANMAKIIENNRETKTILARRRVYKMRQSGHDWRYIAKKLGMKEVTARALLV